MNKENYILPLCILLGAIVLAGTYYFNENNKLINEKEIEKLRISQEVNKQDLLKKCFDDVQKDYIEIAKLNGYEVKDDKFIKAPDSAREKLNERRQQKQDECLKLYK